METTEIWLCLIAMALLASNVLFYVVIKRIDAKVETLKIYLGGTK